MPHPGRLHVYSWTAVSIRLEGVSQAIAFSQRFVKVQPTCRKASLLQMSNSLNHPEIPSNTRYVFDSIFNLFLLLLIIDKPEGKRYLQSQHTEPISGHFFP